jgi:hypothetical protein
MPKLRLQAAKASDGAGPVLDVYVYCRDGAQPTVVADRAELDALVFTEAFRRALGSLNGDARPEVAEWPGRGYYLRVLTGHALNDAPHVIDVTEA